MNRSNFIQVFALSLVVAGLGAGAAASVYSTIAAGHEQSLPAPIRAPEIVETDPPILNEVQTEDVLAQQGDAFASRLRSHRIRLSADGFLPGRINLVDAETGAIRVLKDIKVMFIQNGQVVSTAVPGEGGMFQADGLQPGVYSLAAIGPEGYVAYGLEVLPPANPGPAAPVQPGEAASIDGVVDTVPVLFQEVGSVLAIDSLAIPRRDFDAVIRLARSYIPAEILNASSPEDLPESAQPAESTDEPPPTDESEPTSSRAGRASVWGWVWRRVSRSAGRHGRLLVQDPVTSCGARPKRAGLVGVGWRR